MTSIAYINNLSISQSTATIVSVGRIKYFFTPPPFLYPTVLIHASSFRSSPPQPQEQQCIPNVCLKARILASCHPAKCMPKSHRSSTGEPGLAGIDCPAAGRVHHQEAGGAEAGAAGRGLGCRVQFGPESKGRPPPSPDLGILGEAKERKLYTS